MEHKKKPRKLNFHEQLLRFLKKQKRRIPVHIMILFPVLIVAFAIIYSFDIRTEADAEPEENAQVTGVAVGDVMVGRHVEEVTNRYGYDYLFRYVQPLFNQADYATGNFENVASDRELEPMENKEITLQANRESVAAMKDAGFQTMAMANNHMMDYGEQGMIDTLDTFHEQGIDAVGAGTNSTDASNRISYQEINGLTIATLSFSDISSEETKAGEKQAGILDFDPATFIPLTAEAKKKADYVIVHAHWGREYNSRASDRQKELGRALADAGADLVIGHHPHVLESIEVYDDTVIFYSLGNFIFDQGWSRTRETALVQFHLMPTGETNFEITPMKIREATPAPLSNWDKLSQQSIIRQLTRDLDVDHATVDDKLTFTVKQREGEE